MDAETPAEKARWCAVIAGLPKGQPALVWRLAVKQWNEVNPATGYALKDWSKSWYTGQQQTNMANNRRNRELVALAFARYNTLMLYRFPSTTHDMHLRLNLDEKRFEEEYPECNKGFGELCNAIRRRDCPGQTSRNGTPEERAQRKTRTQ